MIAQNQKVAIKPSSGVITAFAPAPRFSPELITQSDLSRATELPLLSEAPTAPVPLSIQYWSPEVTGETKLCWIVGIGMSEVSDLETGELKFLESVFFVEQTENGQMVRWFTASKILVANIKSAINRGEIIPNTTLPPIKIIYLGLQKNSRNAFKSKRFDILPLIIKTITKEVVK